MAWMIAGNVAIRDCVHKVKRSGLTCEGEVRFKLNLQERKLPGQARYAVLKNDVLQKLNSRF